MAYVAAKTSRIRLVAAVMVVPHRPVAIDFGCPSTAEVIAEMRRFKSEIIEKI